MSTRIGRIAGATGALVATGALAAVAFTAVAGAGSAEPTSAPAAVVETIDYSALPASYGLAAEQEADAAAVVAAEQERIAAEAAAAEAARVAAEQAAAAEAERVAAEQAAAESFDATVEPAPEAAPVDDGIPDGAWPLPWIADPNPENAEGGYYDDSGCGAGSDTFNGVPYCTP